MLISDFNFNRIVVLTGAGVSAESGISTFRNSGGLWETHKVEDVATPEAFQHNPQLVWKFYSIRRLQAAKALPNAAHLALVEFAKTLPPTKEISLITQNVDCLHQKSDPDNFLEPICMHGSLHQSACTHCHISYFDDFAYFDEVGNYAPKETGLCNTTQRSSVEYLHNYKLEYKNFLPLSPCCQAPIRPHIVWFGEIPMKLEKISPLVENCDLFISIGTSGLVYPAAGFLQVAKFHDAKTVCLNLEAIPQNHLIDHFIQGSASSTVPIFFAQS